MNQLADIQRLRESLERVRASFTAGVLGLEEREEWPAFVHHDREILIDLADEVRRYTDTMIGVLRQMEGQ